jgi:PmbA protein
MPQQIDASSINDLKTVVVSALAEAKQCGASQAEADASLQRGLSVTVRLGEVETLEFHRDRGLSVTVYFGQAKGSASTADLRPQAVRETVLKASAIAKHTSEDPCAGLADPAELARKIPELDLHHPWDIEAEQAIVLARECEAAGRATDARLKNSEGATVSTGSGARVHGNSLGFLEGLTSTSHSLSCALIAQERDDMQRDYWYSISRNPASLEPPAAIGRRAAERTLRRLGARQLSTRRAPVLFAPELARGLLGHFIGAIRGPSQYRRASFLLNAAGEQVLPSFIDIVERPHLLQGLASSPYDSEGVATRDRDLVRAGVLQGYVLGSYSARKLGLKTTGNAGGIHNLLVNSGQSGSFDEL